jgi:hypothetical protein
MTTQEADQKAAEIEAQIKANRARYWREKFAVERIEAYIAQRTTSRWVAVKGGQICYTDKLGCRPRKIGKMGLNSYTSDLPW